MTEQLVRKVAVAALRGETADGGWLKIDAPKATEKEISLAVMEAADCDPPGILKLLYL